MGSSWPLIMYCCLCKFESNVIHVSEELVFRFFDFIFSSHLAKFLFLIISLPEIQFCHLVTTLSLPPFTESWRLTRKRNHPEQGPGFELFSFVLHNPTWMEFVVKEIVFFDQKTTIILQNNNGPCPLLAIANVLLLKQIISLPSDCYNRRVITLEELITLLANYALRRASSSPVDHTASQTKMHTQSFEINEILEILPSLAQGLDINVKFTQGVSGYEFTNQIAAFDFFNVLLVHGWLLDEQDAATHDAIGDLSYNQVVEMIISKAETVKLLEEIKGEILLLEEEEQAAKDLKEIIAVEKLLLRNSENETGDAKAGENEDERGGKSWEKKEKKDEEEEKDSPSDDKEKEEKEEYSPRSREDSLMNSLSSKLENLREKKLILESKLNKIQIAREFIDATSAQLTYFGLEQLHSNLKASGFYCFFRNNHFSAAFFDGNQLYLLVTDEGFLKSNITWEKLGNINGDTEYADSHFITAELGSGVENAIGDDGGLSAAITESYRDQMNRFNENGKVEEIAVGTVVSIPSEVDIAVLPRADESRAAVLSSDEQLARQFQLEEDQYHRQQQQQEQQSRHDQQRQTKKKKQENCSIS